MLTFVLQVYVHTNMYMKLKIYPHMCYTYEENISTYAILILPMKEHGRYKHTTLNKLGYVMVLTGYIKLYDAICTVLFSSTRAAEQKGSHTILVQI